ncbi:MAG: YebC/PmpR family DNA-binding transcriptional regulator [Bacteroidota bacterium]
MGRIFQTRKATMFKRYAKMAKQFTKIGKEIVMAVKQGGPHAELNPKLRACIANAKAVNMPKANVDAAIKRASEKDTSNYDEVIYEGHGPYGVPVIVECATDNPTRTIANLRLYFSRSNGSVGTTGSVSFMFERKGLFKVDSTGLNRDDVELDLIDYGAEELTWDDETNELIVQVAFTDFGMMQNGLEEKKYVVKETIKTYIPTTTQELTDEQELEFQKMLDKMEDDDDIMAVYHNLA